MNAIVESPVIATLSLLELVGCAPGILPGISNETYHADRSCASSTGLKEILRSPAHYRAYLDGERKETPDMFLGTAIHARLLEPDLFATTYVSALASDKRTKDWKEFEAAVSAEGKLILTADQTRAIESIADSVATHSSATTLLKAGWKECSVVWQDEETGLWLKARPDCLVADLSVGVCLDVKSTMDAAPEVFARTCVNMDYDLSAAMYLDGLRATLKRDFDFAFLAVEKTDPFGRALYAAPAEMLERGHRRYRMALARLRECIDNQDWPNYQPDGGYDILDWPRWAA